MKAKAHANTKTEKAAIFYAALVLLFFLTAAKVQALPRIEIIKSAINQPLGRSCEVLEDPEGALTLYSVISDQHDADFRPVTAEIPNYGFTPSVYWVRFSAVNNSTADINRYLEIGFPLLDRIELYSFEKKPGGTTELVQQDMAGRDFSFLNRTIKHRNFVFPVFIPSGREIIFYLKIKTDDGMIFPVTFRETTAFTERMQKENFLFGIYYGIILVMALYNFFLFIFTRDRNYLSYILYILFFGLFQMAMNGLAFQYLWPEYVWWAKHANPFFIGMSCLLAALFSFRFLEMPKYTPAFSRIMIVLMAASGILAVSSFFVPYLITIIAGQILPLAMILTAIPAASLCMKRGNRAARFYLIAWITFFIGVILSTLRVMGFIPHNMLTEYGLQIGSGFEMVLLSIALADRINIMKKEKDDAQLEVIAAQQKIVDNLNRSKTEIEEANRLLSLSEEKYRLLVEGSSDIIFSLDEKLEFITANYAIANELKLDPKKIQGLPFRELFYGNDGEPQLTRLIVEEKLDEFIKTREPSQFRAQFISSIITEPKEMNVQLEYVNIGGKNEILGKAYNSGDDSLMKYFESEKQKYIIGNYLITADEITHRVTRNLKKYMEPFEIKLIQIALREIIINAIEHGNLEISFEEKTQALIEDRYFEMIRERQFQPQNINKKVTVEYSVSKEKVMYIVADEGQGFNFENYMDGSADNPNETFLTHGRGIMMTKNAFDEISYNRKGNHVMLIKKFKHSPEKESAAE
ncbi:MAG TPA: 7TM diverse intracellular signaling domain-containing protein [Spirochaetota bacterium]|nr:7TM diverse intracellular signaling domain-containing protein [Spirochaetota bacterium]